MPRGVIEILLTIARTRTIGSQGHQEVYMWPPGAVAMASGACWGRTLTERKTLPAALIVMMNLNLEPFITVVVTVPPNPM